MKALYLETITLLERLHRQSLEIVRTHLDRHDIREINAVQAMILFHIGDEEVTISELTQRGYYLGSNVSYNTTKLLERGYLTQRRSSADRRVFHVRASEKGREIAHLLDRLFTTHAESLTRRELTADALEHANNVLKQVEAVWLLSRTHDTDLASKT